MMYNRGCILLILLSSLAAVSGQCVMRGVCGSSSNHPCVNASQPIPAAPKAQSFCSEAGDTVCCSAEQVEMLITGLQRANLYFGR